MIKSFRSKALERFWVKNDARGIRPEHLVKVTDRLTALNAAKIASDMNIPGYSFHALSGNMAGRYAVKINKNWRVTFAWDETGPDAIDVDYLDYH
jgi:toxin HigB-1